MKNIYIDITKGTPAKIVFAILVIGMIVVFVMLMKESPSGTPQPTTQLQYPSFTEETMDRDCMTKCNGEVDYVNLWNDPLGLHKESRVRAKVPCGTRCWAFNKYRHETGIMFYAVQTNDPRLEESVWGWIDEIFIKWLE